MPHLHVDMEVQDGDWAPYMTGQGPVLRGELQRIGVLPRGMASGAPSVGLLGRTDEGHVVLLETSWKNLSLAMVALITRWGTP